MLGADAVKGVIAGRFVVRLGLFVDGEAIGELGTVVGQHGVDFELEALEEAGEKAGGGVGPAIGEDFQVEKAGGAVDRDVGVTAAAVERRQVLDVDVNEAGRGVGVKGHRRGFLGGEAGRDPVRCRQRWMGLRDSSGLRQRRIASTMSSSGKARPRRSSTTRASFPRRHGGVQPVPAR